MREEVYALATIHEQMAALDSCRLILEEWDLGKLTRGIKRKMTELEKTERDLMAEITSDGE